MKYKKQTLDRLESIRNRIDVLNKNASRGVPINREEFINFTQDLLNRVDELSDSVSLESDSTLRYSDNVL